MTRSTLTHVFILAAVIGLGSNHPAGAQAQAPAQAQDVDLAGRWTLNPGLSSPPTEVGFGVDWVATDENGQPISGSRGRRGGGRTANNPFAAARESEDDSKRIRQLTAEVQSPSAHLTIADSMTAVTMTDDNGRARTFHPDGRNDVVQLDSVPVSVAAKREGGRLIIVYKVEEGRELRYTFARTVNPAQLQVLIEFVGRGGGDEVRRVYEPAKPGDTLAASIAKAAQETAQGAPGGTPTPANPPGKPGTPPPGTVPASGNVPASGQQQEAFDQRPDAELRGITKLGLVVEDLGQQAAACGLKHDAVQAAVSKRLSDAGFKVVVNSDEDTYVYISIMAASLSTGFCVSRYDAFLYSHTTARLSHTTMPVLVQASLLHNGGIAGSAPAAHGDSVIKNLLEYLDQFSSRIHDASKPQSAQ